ncbi:ATP-binding protein [Pasteurella bettyae]|uniref:Aerobic respiration control sensor protein n=1 Tax=Pasteurella bettyae CCUG 2042 TaxID=1095749 RepID=I3D7L1_9PAST|nr:ATP-binding protein [Pasteurella bettyae]EIJ67704.1 aerobic respiration control sensor protein ArcB [Pasteurella bettyae CCUG 2042]SUB22233.1 sensor histidine kinase-like protein [Pasteurella bettyae]
MKNMKFFAQQYVDWVIKLGRLKFSLLGFILIASLALCTHILLSLIFTGKIHWESLLYSVVFGVISAPFVIYFFALLVERLELSRQNLTNLVAELQQEIKVRIRAERRLEQASRDKTTLMATISHELRTPLNGIVGLSRILLDTHLNDEQRNYLKTINISAVSLGHIFNDIIDLQKIDGSKIELYKRETDFPALITDIYNLGKLMAEQKNLCFDIQVDENLPHWIMLDYTRLSQVLWNLMSNAVKFTEKGAVSLQIKRLSYDKYSFAVKDTGQGIPQSELAKIFAMYYQVGSKTNKHKAAGSGIGLAISKNIARLMDGDLTVESKEGKGSTFTLVIKADEVNQPLNNEVEELGLNLHILLVEDIELNIIVAKSVLEKLGHYVDIAMTGQEALEKFEKGNYDLVFLDIQLPDMTGFDIAKVLRNKYEDGVYDYLPPLIALTANVMQSKVDYQKQGMDDVLRKPLSIESLNKCLIEYFGDEIGVPMKSLNSAEIESSLDIEEFDYVMLKDLIDMLGVEFVQKNLELFKQTMPSYMVELHNSYQKYLVDSAYKKEVASNSHKIKGAASSIGLKHIQQVAEKGQHDDNTEWESNIKFWINEIEETWLSDVEKLTKWLVNQ